MEVSFEEFKKRLGNRAHTLSDAEIEALRDMAVKASDILFTTWNNQNINYEQQ